MAAYDLVIRNAQIYDGNCAAPIRADLAITGERIAAVGTLADDSGASVLDGRGLALAPGFIDVHSHDDFAVLLDPAMDFKVMQGVTAEVVGNCGMGAAPFKAASRILGALHPDAKLPKWDGYPGYLDALNRNPPSLNVAVLVGHGTLRYAAMGNAKRAPAAGEMAAMRRTLSEGLEAGCVGISTGLIYEPGRYARTEELIELAREMAATGGLYASHMRNEAARLLDSVRETIRIGEEAGVPIQISHHKASGRDNWGRVRESLKLIEQARERGLDVTADQYPYTSGSTSLFAVIQNGALGGPTEDGGLGLVEPEEILLASAPRHPEWEGRNLREIAAEMKLEPAVAADRIVEQEGVGAVVVLESMDEDDVRTVMRHPSTMIGSDGLAMGSKPHPRLYGCFPRVLGRYARELKLLTTEEAIHRMTAMAAKKFRLKDRGAIRAGAFADLVLFDPAAIRDTATYGDPRRYPAGISHVFVNGTAVVKDGHHTGARPGHALRRA